MGNFKKENYRGTIYFGDIPTEVDTIDLEIAERTEEDTIDLEIDKKVKENILDKESDEVEEYRLEENINFDFSRGAYFKFENFEGKSSGSGIKFIDNNYLHSNNLNFKWKVGINKVRIAIKQIDENYSKISVEVKAPQNIRYNRSWAIQKEYEFNCIRFIYENYGLHNTVNIKEMTINGEPLGESIKFKSSINIWSMERTERIKELVLKFEVLVSGNYTTNKDSSFKIFIENSNNKNQKS